MLNRKGFKGFKWALLALAAILALITVTPVFATASNLGASGSSPTSSTSSTNGVTLTAKFWIGDTTYEVNGEKRSMDIAPYIKDGRTLLPLRYAAYAVGLTEKDVQWDQAARKVTIKKGADTAMFTIGSKSMVKNGQTTVMDVCPVIANGRTMVPIRYVGEALGANVKWDADNWMITITLGGTQTGDQTEEQTTDQTTTTTQAEEAVANGTVVSIPIDMTAAWNGTLLPKPGAQTGADEWGLEPKAERIECKVGSRYATVTRLDGSKYTLDLGTEVVVVNGKTSYANELITNFPSIYNKNNTLVDETITDKNGNPAGPCYIPFIPVAEAFGVPAANIVWDGTHLAVFGYYGHKEDYRILTVGSREAICKVIGNKPEISTGHSNFPLYVRNGVPMLGVDSVNDFDGMLFSNPAGPNLLNAPMQEGGGFDYANGEVEWGL